MAVIKLVLTAAALVVVAVNGANGDYLVGQVDHLGHVDHLAHFISKRAVLLDDDFAHHGNTALHSRMTRARAWASTMLLAAAVVGVVAELRPGLRHPRQATPPSSDEERQCLLDIFAGISRPECQKYVTPTQPKPPVLQPTQQLPSQDCVCARHWHCKDKGAQAPDDNGDLVGIVNVRSAGGNTCVVVEDICCRDIDTSLPPPRPRNIYTPACGNRNPKGVGGIFKGFTESYAQFGEFPWMVVVMTADQPLGSGQNAYISGGSLVHPSFVMTAAHYVADKAAKDVAVRLGEWNIKAPTEPIKHQEILVSQIHLHPDFNPKSLKYDVALLQLKQPAQLGPTVDTICLPSPFQKFDGSQCVSSGWGKDIFGQEGKYQQILKTVTLPAMNHRSCEAALRRTRLGSNFILDQTFMCAGGQRGKDLCTGDGGSPLVCPKPGDPNRYVQAGIVAWGIGCGTEGVPGVYADVSQAMPWINQVVQLEPEFDIRFGPVP
ncbi:phenoloxidase-activating factor 2 isoform X2 [Procambarus clarkii]|uniref:phenoloxidase-activating factor 2 isoform X2 n=1 Tax=Procambarus clarkii TaxID=6728 RepID=UPI003743C022